MIILILCLQISRSDIRPHARKLVCQSSGCRGSLQSSLRVCVGMYGLAYSHCHPQGWDKKIVTTVDMYTGQ